MEAVAAPGHVHDILPMQDVIRYSRAVLGRYSLLRSQAVFVVLERNGLAGPAHLRQLTAMLPGIRPGAVAGGVANGVMAVS